MKTAVTVIQVLCGLFLIAVVLLQSGKSAGLSAAIGGGGLGSLAINNGYQRRMYLVLYVSVILLVIMVQIFQSLGTHTANRLDRRNTKARKRSKRNAGESKTNDAA